MAGAEAHTEQFRALHLKAGEEIFAAEAGWLEADKGPGAAGGSGAAIVTDRRAVFYRKRILGGYLLKTIPLEALVTTEHRRGLTRAGVVLHSAHEKLALGFRGEGAVRFHTAVETARDLARGSGARTASAAASLDSLRRLREQALVSDEEYAAKREEILARL